MKSKFTLKTIFTVIVAVIIIILLSFLAYTRFSVAGMQDRAIKLMAAGKYEEAYDLYEKIALKTGTQEDSDLREKAYDLINSDNMFNEGTEKLSDGDYMGAIKAFSLVSKDDSRNYKTAQKLLSDASEKIFNDARSYADDLEFNDALKVLKEYIDIVEDNSEAVSVYDEILLEKEEYKKGIDRKKRDREREKELEREKILSKEMEKNSEENDEELEEVKIDVQKKQYDNTTTPFMDEMANKLRNKTHTVQSYEANVRKGPSMDSKSIKTIKKGSTIKVYDTITDGNKRVWCRGTITTTDGETIEGWISNRNLDGTL